MVRKVDADPKYRLRYADTRLTADGTVILEERDLEELGVEMNKDAYHQDVTLITKDNLTYDQSLQINGPIGNEGFIAPKYAEILNNVARGQSCQINYAISTKQWNEAREQQLAVVDKIFVQGKLGKEEMVQVLQNQNNSAQPDNDRVRQGKIERSQGQSLLIIIFNATNMLSKNISETNSQTNKKPNW